MDIDYSEKCIVHKAQLMKPDLVLQTANTVDLRDGMEQTKKEKSQLSAANRKLSEMEAPKQKEPKKAVGWASYLGKKVTTALRRLKHKCKFSTKVDLKPRLDGRQCDESCHKEEEEQMMEMENQKLQNALKETEEELKTQLDQRQRDKSCHLEELEKSRSTFLAQAAILKKERDQFMADRLQWEQEKASLLEEIRASCFGQLNEQKIENQKLQWEQKKALRNAEQHFEDFQELREDLQCENINTRRECILRSLVIYLNEDPDAFFKEYLASAPEDAERDIADTVMGIYVIRREPEDVGLVIEGVQILNKIDGVLAVC